MHTKTLAARQPSRRWRTTAIMRRMVCSPPSHKGHKVKLVAWYHYLMLGVAMSSTYYRWHVSTTMAKGV